MEKDRQYNGEGQTIQWRRTDNTMEKDRQYNGAGQTIQWRRTDDTMEQDRQYNGAGQTIQWSRTDDTMAEVIRTKRQTMINKTLPRISLKSNNRQTLNHDVN
jgi:hypothetical protein